MCRLRERYLLQIHGVFHRHTRRTRAIHRSRANDRVDDVGEVEGEDKDEDLGKVKGDKTQVQAQAQAQTAQAKQWAMDCGLGILGCKLEHHTEYKAQHLV